MGKRKGPLYAAHAPTPSEIKVIQLLSEGYNTPEIAKQLHLSGNTVKTHIRDAGIRMGLKHNNRTLIVAECLRNGYIE